MAFIVCLHFVEVKGALVISSIGPSFFRTWRQVEDKQFLSSGLRFPAAVLIFLYICKDSFLQDWGNYPWGHAITVGKASYWPCFLSMP